MVQGVSFTELLFHVLLLFYNDVWVWSACTFGVFQAVRVSHLEAVVWKYFNAFFEYRASVSRQGTHRKGEGQPRWKGENINRQQNRNKRRLRTFVFTIALCFTGTGLWAISGCVSCSKYQRRTSVLCTCHRSLSWHSSRWTSKESRHVVQAMDDPKQQNVQWIATVSRSNTIIHNTCSAGSDLELFWRAFSSQFQIRTLL